MRTSFMAVALVAALASDLEAQRVGCTVSQRAHNQCPAANPKPATPAPDSAKPPQAVVPAPAVAPDTASADEEETPPETAARPAGSTAAGATTPTPSRQRVRRDLPHWSGRLQSVNTAAYLTQRGGMVGTAPNVVRLNTHPDSLVVAWNEAHRRWGSDLRFENPEALARYMRTLRVVPCPQKKVELTRVRGLGGTVIFGGWSRVLGTGIYKDELCLLDEELNRVVASLTCGNIILDLVGPPRPAPVTPSVTPPRNDTLVLRTDSIFIERTVTLPQPPITIKVEDDGLPWGKIGIAAGIVGAGACAYYSDKFGYDWYDFKCFVSRQRTDVEVIHLTPSSIGLRLMLP